MLAPLPNPPANLMTEPPSWWKRTSFDIYSETRGSLRCPNCGAEILVEGAFPGWGHPCKFWRIICCCRNGEGGWSTECEGLLATARMVALMRA
jgi:hypothetical protein